MEGGDEYAVVGQCRAGGRVYQDAIFDTKEKAFSGVKIPKKA